MGGNSTCREGGTLMEVMTRDATFAARYDVEWSPNATINLHVERAIGDTSPDETTSRTIAVPTRSSQKRRGSVRDRVPEPSESADLERISWRESDAGMNMSSSAGLRREMSIGMSGVRSLVEFISVQQKRGL